MLEGSRRVGFAHGTFDGKLLLDLHTLLATAVHAQAVGRTCILEVLRLLRIDARAEWASERHFGGVVGRVLSVGRLT
jgi:hypothetical protein